MAWNKNLPDDATKIRNAPTVIQENWDAIESGSSSLEIGSVNYYDRNAAGSTYSSDPAIISTSSILYAKKDSDNISRIFALDPNGDTSQLTPFISTIAASIDWKGPRNAIPSLSRIGTIFRVALPSRR